MFRERRGLFDIIARDLLISGNDAGFDRRGAAVDLQQLVLYLFFIEELAQQDAVRVVADSAVHGDRTPDPRQVRRDVRRSARDMTYSSSEKHRNGGLGGYAPRDSADVLIENNVSHDGDTNVLELFTMEYH